MFTSSSSAAATNCVATLVVAASLFACSAEPEPKPKTAPSYTLIDDMEGTTGRIAWMPQNPAPDATAGRWVSYADIQCEDLSPIPEWAPNDTGGWSYTALPEPFETEAGVMSQHAARLRTTAPLVNTWGAGMGFQFSEPPLGTDPTRVTRPCTNGAAPDLDYPSAPVDLSAYSALVFWGMADPAAGSTKVLIQFQDSNTDPRGGVCDPTPETDSACYNGFGVVLTLGDTFERYVIDFSELEQNPNWGYHPRPSAIDLRHVYGLSFQMDTPGGTCPPPITCPGGLPELAFDVWVDDLYFVSH